MAFPNTAHNFQRSIIVSHAHQTQGGETVTK